LSGTPVVAAKRCNVVLALAAKKTTITDCITWIGATINAGDEIYFLWELELQRVLNSLADTDSRSSINGVFSSSKLI